MNQQPRRQPRGTARRDAIIEAAAALVVETGPSGVTHRSIAQRAGVPLASTTYYFESLDDLVGEAGKILAARWAGHAVEVAEGVTGPIEDLAEQARVLIDAVLPEGDEAAVRGHYEHLLAAGRNHALATAYGAGRGQLDAAVSALVDKIGARINPAPLIALIDGAAVTALSEGRDTRELAQSLVLRALTFVRTA